MKNATTTATGTRKKKEDSFFSFVQRIVFSATQSCQGNREIRFLCKSSRCFLRIINHAKRKGWMADRTRNKFVNLYPIITERRGYLSARRLVSVITSVSFCILAEIILYAFVTDRVDRIIIFQILSSSNSCFHANIFMYMYTSHSELPHADT